MYSKKLIATTILMIKKRFFGRKQNVEILIKYLIANLRKNGGILDRIKFAVKTKNKCDLDYLNELFKLNLAVI